MRPTSAQPPGRVNGRPNWTPRHREMRACGDEQVRRDARVDTRIRARARMEGEHIFVAACVPEAAVSRDRPHRCESAAGS